MASRLNRSNRKVPNILNEDFAVSLKKEKPIKDWQKLILSAPTWTNAEHKNFLKGRIKKR